MMRACLAALAFLAIAACGPKVPQHNGYKTKSPWKKAKPIALTDNAGKVKGTLDYAEYKRAKWYTLDLPENGDLNLALSFDPTDDAGDATVAMEVLDASYHVISEDPDAPLVAPDKGDDGDDGDDASGDDEGDDEDSGDDGGEESDTTQKARALDALAPGRYYIHLFVTKRLDAADYTLELAFTPMPTEVKTDFPKSVAFAPSLPMVPVADDAPAPVVHKDPPPPKCKGKKCKKPPKEHVEQPQDTPPPPESKGTVTADVIAVDAGGSGGSDITINAGTEDGLAVGRAGSLKGVKNGGFTLSACKAHSCTAHVKASPEEVKHSSMAVKIP